MLKRPLVWAGRVLLGLGLGLGLWGALDELRTESYLEGFARATVPESAPALTKVRALMSWLRDPPAWSTRDSTVTRDPILNLENQRLLEICGTVTNVFVNLAHTIGLHSRPLILAREDYSAKHVVAEVLVDGRWIVVDPTYRRVLRAADGRTLTVAELRDPEIWREATRGLPAYNPSYTYDRTTHVRFERIPGGHLVRRFVNAVAPGWEDHTETLTLVLERRSFQTILLAAFLVLVGLALETIRIVRRRRHAVPPLVLAPADKVTTARPSVRAGGGFGTP